MPRNLRALCVAIGLICVATLAAWQALTVHYSYGDNWTSLYCTGALFHTPPAALASEHIYIFQNSPGYDGQVYHYIAHDPFFRRGFSAYLDDARYRYRRILVPGLAFLLALGHDGGIDFGYLIVVCIFIFLGAWWLSRWAVLRGYPAQLGLLFGVVPAVLVSIDRLTVDVALAACCAGFSLYVEERSPRRLYAVLVAATLARETGLLLLAGYCIYLGGVRRFRAAAVYLTAGIPAACWYAFVSAHTVSVDSRLLSPALFVSLVNRMLHPFPYPLTGAIRVLAITLDLVALAGTVTVVLWAVYRGARRAWTPITVTLYLFAMLAATLSNPELWAESYAFGRTLTPLLLLGALDGLTAGSLVPLLAMLAVETRIGLQLGGQVLNVVHGILG